MVNYDMTVRDSDGSIVQVSFVIDFFKNILKNPKFKGLWHIGTLVGLFFLLKFELII